MKFGEREVKLFRKLPEVFILELRMSKQYLSIDNNKRPSIIREISPSKFLNLRMLDVGK